VALRLLVERTPNSFYQPVALRETVMRKLNIVQQTSEVIRHSFGPTLAFISLMSMATFAPQPVALAQNDPSWITTGSLNIARSNYTATLLADGRVLVVGGYSYVDYSVLSSAELYDPATGTWASTGSLNIPRSGHTATLLANGKVLVVGEDQDGSSAELFDPSSGTWSVTGSLNIARYGHTATLLQSGKVLIAGGGGGDGRAELYDPATGTWSITGGLITDRGRQTATLLQNGQVLIAGGWFDEGDGIASFVASAELYDPATGTWRVTGNLNAPRSSHTATLLPDGRVLIAAGVTDNWVPDKGGFAVSPTSLNSAELYDPATGMWSVTASLNTVRDSHTATLLPNGKVLVAGGSYWTIDGNTPNDGTFPCGDIWTCRAKALDTAEIYDPATRNWTATVNLNAARFDPTATRLQNGQVLVAGGDRLGSAELFEQSLSISINDAIVTEGNAGTANVTFQVNLSAPSSQPVTVTFSTANRTASAGSDYVGTSGTLTFDPGETTKTITVAVDGNDTLELNKTFVVNLTSATNAFIADGQGVGTIVNDDGPLPQTLANISSRGGVLTGDNVMIGGFIVDGSIPKRVLVRSRGPSMVGAPFFVPGTLPNPQLQLFSGSTVIAQNDNWQDAPNCPGFICEGATEILNTGLDPCTPNPGQSSSPANCALEAAILITLPPGPYTAIVRGADGTTGIGLVEVFEADASTVSELSNISTRGFVQSGDDVMIGGLIIEGSAPATVLIRARGPSMSGAPFFVPGTLANPFLQIFSGQDVIAQNDNWQDAPSCNGFGCGTAAQIAATGLDPCQPNPGQPTSPPSCSLESAILITLPPGAYTAILSGVGGGTGVGLVEAFEMD
jgi:hypothetical protein